MLGGNTRGILSENYMLIETKQASKGVQDQEKNSSIKTSFLHFTKL
jgi:hypothetical protein